MLIVITTCLSPVTVSIYRLAKIVFPDCYVLVSSLTYMIL